MPTPSTWLSTRVSSRTRQILASITLSAFVVFVAALPAVPAGASPTPEVTLPAEVSGVPSSEVQELLAGLPLNDLSATQLSKLLSQLPGLSTLPTGPLQEALTKAIDELAGEGDTLGQLSNPAELVSKLESQLKGLLSPSELLSLLKGESLSTLLTDALGSPEPTQLVGELLNSASKPEQLIEQVLAAVNPSKLEALLGTTLTGESVTKTTVGELASNLGTTDQELAKSLNTTPTELPPSAMALTTTLTNGKTLGVLDGAKELSLATLVPSKEAGSGGSGGPGGSGGTSGEGSSGTPGSTTLVVNNGSARSTNAVSPGVKAAAAKIKIISRKVRGDAVTVVVQVPGAGRLTLAGSGVRSVSKQTSTAERVTLRTALTKAGVASRRKHRHGIKVKLKASFKPVDGSSSAATTAAVFR